MEHAPRVPATVAAPDHAARAAHPWPSKLDLDASLALLLHRSASGLRWLPRDHEPAGVDVAGRAALSQLAALLADGDWAIVVHSGAERRWAQVMRADDAWVVEVHDGTAGDWASRIVRASEPGDRRDRFNPDETASAIWAWMHGGLPGGLERVRLSPTASGIAADGREWCTADLP